MAARRTSAAMAGILLTVACGRSESPSQSRPRPPGEPFAVLATQAITLFKLESGVRIPTFGGSRASAETVVSDDPSIASVSADGLVVGHRAGTTTLRSRAGAPETTRVTVRPLTSIVLDAVPPLSLQPGEIRSLHAQGSDGLVIPDDEVHWFTSDRDVAIVSSDGIKAGRKQAVTHVWATCGSLSSAQLEVRVASAPPTILSKSHYRLKVGSVTQLDDRRALSAESRWSSSDSKILKSMPAGYFWAKRPGHAVACLSDRSQRSCVEVEVFK